METDFKTNITDIDIYYQPEEVDSVSGSLEVKWGCEFEMRNWGMKGATLSVYDVTGTMLYEFIGDEREEKEVDIKSLGFEIDTEYTDQLKLTDNVCPQGIEVNYRDKKILVKF